MLGAGPVGQPSPDTITTAVRLAPRQYSLGGGAVVPMSKQDEMGAAKAAPAKRHRISQAPPPIEHIRGGSYVVAPNAESDRPSAGTLQKNYQSDFEIAERYCWEVIFDERRPNVGKQQWADSIKPRWSELRPQLDQAFSNCRDVGTPADKLSELDGRLKRLDYKWKLVCQSRERASPNPVPVTTAGDETAATKALVSHLQTNPDLKREDAAKWCKEEGYTLSGRGLKDRVWPQARVTAGLPAKGLPGRKRKSAH